MSLDPMPGYAVIELEDKYSNVSAKTKSYEGASRGIIRGMGAGEIANFADPVNLIGSRAFWTELVAGNPIIRDGKNYVFLRVDRIEGVENVE